MINKVIVLGDENYLESGEKRYGDCIIIFTDNDLIVYDCGSVEHAKRVIGFMHEYGISKVSVILSHNDSDHFDGILYLVEMGVVKAIYTTLLLKYVKQILFLIDDNRRSKESVKNAILDKYDNISKLSGENLIDIYEFDEEITDGIRIIGPDKGYMLATVARCLDGREGEITDGETNINATSVQVSVNLYGHNMLLCGDSSFAAIESKLEDYDVIQLPHHGKSDQAEAIFNAKRDALNTIYIVSDNTGNTNGGSDSTDFRGHRVYNTKDGSDIVLDASFFSRNIKPVGCLDHEMYIVG